MTDKSKSLDINPDVVVVHDGRLKRIRRAVDLDHVAVDDIETGTCEIVLISALTVVGHDSPASPPPQRVDVADVPGADWDIAREREKIIMSLIDKPGRTRAEVEERAKEFGYEVTTLYRWMTDYEPTRTLESLLPKQQSIAKGKSRLPKLVEDLINLALAKYPKELNTIHEVYKEVKERCKRLNLKPPHEGTIRNRTENLPLPDVLARRHGRKAARDQFDPKPDHYEEATHPLSVYQIDHLRMPTHVVDEKYRKPIGKAWATLVIDVFSRTIPGFCVLLEAPGTMNLGLAMGHAILPKESWLAARRIEASWPLWGVPTVIHADNAKEFRGNTLKLAADNLKTRIEWRAVKTPEYGGHIERLCGTLRRELERLPGGELRPGKGNEDQEPEAEACLTLRELERWITLHIVNVYHKHVHTGIGLPPIVKFNDGILGTDESPGIGYPKRILDERWLRLQWMPFKYRTVQQYGIQWDGVHYWDPALIPFINTIDPETGKSRLFIARRDPRDISRIYLWIPDLNDHLDVPYGTASRPAVTVWELRAAQAELRKRGESATDEDAIFRTIEQQRQLVAEAAQKTKSARRFEQRTRESERSVKETGVGPKAPEAATEPLLDYGHVVAFEEVDDGNSH